jgi:predicted DNA-binding transcriptional regulator YafY
MGKKWDDRRNGEKLLRLFTILMHRKRSWPLKEIARELNCHKASALRLIDQLNSSLYATVNQEKVGRESHYSLEISKAPPSLPLSSEGLTQLSAIRDFAHDLLPDQAQKALDVVLDQAAAMASDDLDALSFKANRLVKGHIDYRPFQESYQCLTEAIRKGAVVEVSYKSSLLGDPKRLDYAPKILSLYHESLRFLGWIVDKRDKALYDEPTALLLHRMESVKATERKAAKLPDPLDFEAGHFGLINETDPFEVSLRFAPEASQYVWERQWSPDQKARLLDDGSLELVMSSRSEMETIQWVLGFGEKVEVLSPDWLKGEIRKVALALLGKYGK